MCIDPLTSTRITQPYKTNYGVCENISREAISTRILSSDYSTPQAGTVNTELQYILLYEAGNISCQGYNGNMWPIGDKCALYDIQLTGNISIQLHCKFVIISRGPRNPSLRIITIKRT